MRDDRPSTQRLHSPNSATTNQSIMSNSHRPMTWAPTAHKRNISFSSDSTTQAHDGLKRALFLETTDRSRKPTIYPSGTSFHRASSHQHTALAPQSKGRHALPECSDFSLRRYGSHTGGLGLSSAGRRASVVYKNKGNKQHIALICMAGSDGGRGWKLAV